MSVMSIADLQRSRSRARNPPTAPIVRAAWLDALATPCEEWHDMPPTADIRKKREDLVREHMESENVHEFDRTIATFDHPRYEIIPTGDVFDGPQEVERYFDETRTAFPDQRNELIAMHHGDDSVIVEFTLKGTHKGSFRGLPATGKAFECRCLSIFVFDGDSDRLVCERAYFDSATILRQLGIAHDPLTLKGRVATVLNHPLTVGSAVARSLIKRG
jgi:steroid delta-isomerase-like uncharacterized protein